jgi:hypothetical protein
MIINLILDAIYWGRDQLRPSIGCQYSSVNIVSITIHTLISLTF